jgi:hypothetical protein
MAALFAIGMIVAGSAMSWVLVRLTPSSPFARSGSEVLLGAPMAGILFVYLLVKRARKQPLKELPRLD